MMSRGGYYSLQILKLTVGSVFLLFVGTLLLSCDSNTKTGKAVEDNKQSSDLTAHPVYSKYQFGTDDKTIDFGTQPLAIPTGTVAEAMQRDQVLRNLLAESGFTLKLHSFEKGGDINFFMKRGDIELAVSGDMPTVSAAADNYGVAIALHQQNFSSIITKKIEKLANLKGRRVGYAPGSSAHFLLLNALQTEGLTAKDVVMVPLKINEMIDALEHNSIDAFSAWEPTPTLALKKMPEAKVIHRAITTSYLYCAKSFLKRHPETVKLLIASIVRSMRWMELSRENVLLASDWCMTAESQFTGKDSELTRDEYAELIHSGLVNIASSPIIPMSLLTESGQIYNEFHFLQKAGSIAPEVTWEPTLENFDRQMMTEVLNNPNQFRLADYKFSE